MFSSGCFLVLDVFSGNINLKNSVSLYLLESVDINTDIRLACALGEPDIIIETCITDRLSILPRLCLLKDSGHYW